MPTVTHTFAFALLRKYHLMLCWLFSPPLLPPPPPVFSSLPCSRCNLLPRRVSAGNFFWWI